jgi:hypothetical protein
LAEGPFSLGRGLGYFVVFFKLGITFLALRSVLSTKEGDPLVALVHCFRCRSSYRAHLRTRGFASRACRALWHDATRPPRNGLSG